MSNTSSNIVHCDICHLKCREDGKGFAFYMKNCKDHRVACNVCYKIITRDGKKVECPCCRNIISEFINLPTPYYDITHEFPFTI